MSAYEEITETWRKLEAKGFPPEVVGSSIEGHLPEAVDAALECLVRQRNDLLREVLELRKSVGAVRIQKRAEGES